MFPQLFGDDTCLKQAINSVKSCTNGGNNCKLTIGGKNSKCLRISKISYFNYYYGKKQQRFNSHLLIFALHIHNIFNMLTVSLDIIYFKRSFECLK